MLIHLLFDIIAYTMAGWLSWKLFKPSHKIAMDKLTRHNYYMSAIIGFVLGSVIFGSLNVYFSMHQILPAKSIVGALFGGIVAIEIYKRMVGIIHSTGAYFAPSLAIGIAIGRIGCFLSGLEDYTYGTPTTLPWGYDFGDGVLRHPVQLYESGVMLLFFIYASLRYYFNEQKFAQSIFYEFIFVYALNRFLLEFIKPYQTIALGLNLFQFICIILMIYALIYYQRSTHGTLLKPI